MEEKEVATAIEKKNLKEQTFSIAKNIGNQSFVKNMVEKTIEFLLPYLFWIGLLVIFYKNIVVSFIGVNWGDKVLKNYASTMDKIEYFVLTTLTEVSIFLIAFYLIYALMEIRNASSQTN